MTYGGACMNFYETFTISVSGRIISAPQAGGTASQRSQIDANSYATRGIDLFADPYGSDGSVLSHSACPSATTPPFEWWENQYPPSNFVAQAIFVNRMDGGLNLRIVQGGSSLSVIGHNGTVQARMDLTGAAVQALTLAPYLAPMLPDAQSDAQTSYDNRVRGVRYVMLSTPKDTVLHFR